MGNCVQHPAGKADAGKELILIENGNSGGANTVAIPTGGGCAMCLLACQGVPDPAALAKAVPVDVKAETLQTPKETGTSTSSKPSAAGSKTYV